MSNPIEYVTFTPTMELRWIDARRGDVFLANAGEHARYLKLQQAYRGSDGSVEWRDIPVSAELDQG